MHGAAPGEGASPRGLSAGAAASAVNTAGKVWGPRRKRAVAVIGAELIIHTVNLVGALPSQHRPASCVCVCVALVSDAEGARKPLSPRSTNTPPSAFCHPLLQVFYLAPNAFVLAQPCSWFLTPVYVFSAVRWTCWNTVGACLCMRCVCVCVCTQLSSAGSSCLWGTHSCAAVPPGCPPLSRTPRRLQLFCLFVVQAHNPLPAQYTGYKLLHTAVVETAQAAGHYVQRVASREWQRLLRRLPARASATRHLATVSEPAAGAAQAVRSQPTLRAGPAAAAAPPGQLAAVSAPAAVGAASLEAAEAGGANTPGEEEGTPEEEEGREAGPGVERMVADLPARSHVFKVGGLLGACMGYGAVGARLKLSRGEPPALPVSLLPCRGARWAAVAGAVPLAALPDGHCRLFDLRDLHRW